MDVRPVLRSEALPPVRELVGAVVAAPSARGGVGGGVAARWVAEVEEGPADPPLPMGSAGDRRGAQEPGPGVGFMPGAGSDVRRGACGHEAGAPGSRRDRE